MKPWQPDKEDAIGDVAAARWNGGDLPILSTDVVEGKATPHVSPDARQLTGQDLRS